MASDPNFGRSSVLGWKNKTVIGVILSCGMRRDCVCNLLENEMLGIQKVDEALLSMAYNTNWKNERLYVRTDIER